MLYVTLVISLIFLLGIALFELAVLLTRVIFHREICLSFIFHNFKEKMGMTLGLGCIFFGLYALVVGSMSSSAWQLRTYFFSLVHRNPLMFIYLGLGLFSCLSICVYLVRLLIKQIYNKY